MTEYINMWKNFFNFSDRTTVRGYWMAFLFHVIALVVLLILSSIVEILGIFYLLYSLAAMIPALAMMVRRFRDAGKHWANIFWAFLPIIGLIIMIVFLCKSSVEDNGIPVV